MSLQSLTVQRHIVLSCLMATQASSCGNLHSVYLPPVSSPPREVTMPRDAVHPHGMVEHRDVHNM